MSRFDNHMAVAVGHLKTAFGDTVTYKPPGGESVQITAHAGPIDFRRDEDEMGGYMIKTREITIPISELAAPLIDAIITVAGEEFVVTEMPVITASFTELTCRAVDITGRRHETAVRRIE